MGLWDLLDPSVGSVGFVGSVASVGLCQSVGFIGSLGSVGSSGSVSPVNVPCDSSSVKPDCHSKDSESKYVVQSFIYWVVSTLGSCRKCLQLR